MCGICLAAERLVLAGWLCWMVIVSCREAQFQHVVGAGRPSGLGVGGCWGWWKNGVDDNKQPALSLSPPPPTIPPPKAPKQPWLA